MELPKAQKLQNTLEMYLTFTYFQVVLCMCKIALHHLVTCIPYIQWSNPKEAEKSWAKKIYFQALKFKVGFNQFHCCNFGFRLKNQGDQKTRKFPLGLWIILLKKCVPGKLQSFFLQTCMYRKKSNIMVSICTCCIVKAEKCEVNAKQNRRKKKTLFSFFLPQYFEFSRLNTI